MPPGSLIVTLLKSLQKTVQSLERRFNSPAPVAPAPVQPQQTQARTGGRRKNSEIPPIDELGLQNSKFEYGFGPLRHLPLERFKKYAPPTHALMRVPAQPRPLTALSIARQGPLLRAPRRLHQAFPAERLGGARVRFSRLQCAGGYPEDGDADEEAAQCHLLRLTNRLARPAAASSSTSCTRSSRRASRRTTSTSTSA